MGKERSEHKHGLGVDVLTAARRRIAWVFDTFPVVYMAGPSGKDSGAMMHLVCQEARNRGCKVGVLYLDLEAQYKVTIEHIVSMFELYADVVDPYWLAIPLHLRNSVSMHEPYWICWDPEREVDWVRQKPERAIGDWSMFPFYRPPWQEGGQRMKSDSSEVEDLATRLVSVLSGLSLAERVEALNLVRSVLHEVSPFRDEPVDLVLWVKGEQVMANNYNPNAVAPPEMRLLRLSIEEDGYTQPIVAHEVDDGNEVVDGFHRLRCGKEAVRIRERVHGYLPITRIRAERAARNDRIASTIRHNRARGEHAVDSMSAIVRMLYEAGWKDEQIQKELGMGADEVLRLKQITGLAALFAESEFSEAWEADMREGADGSP